MAYTATREENFDEHFFNISFDGCSIFAAGYVENYVDDNIRLTFSARDCFLQGYRNFKSSDLNYFYIKGYEIIGGGQVPAGYFAAYIKDETLNVTAFLAAKRKGSTRPYVTDPQMWIDLMAFTKDEGCKKFIWHSHPKVRVWKGLQIMGSRLPWKTEYESGHNSQDATMTIYLDEAA
jgi:hypothetical protein